MPFQNLINISFDGMMSITDAITAWNSSNPGHQVTLTSGDGAEIPTVGSAMVIGGGYDFTVYSLTGSSSGTPKYCDLDAVRLMDSSSTGINGIFINNSSILGGDLTSFEAYCIIKNSMCFTGYSTTLKLPQGGQFSN
jgi:hypothetical protein